MVGEVGVRSQATHPRGAAPLRREVRAAAPAHFSPRHSHALAELAREVAGVGTPAEWGARATAAVASVAGWERVYVFRRNETTGALELLASHGISAAQAQKSAVLDPKGLSLTALGVK